MQRVVSVVACHLVEHSEDVARLLRAVVRLQALDDLYGIPADANELIGPARPDERGCCALACSGFGRHGENREFVMPPGRPAVRDHERPDEMIEDGSPVIQTLSHRDRESLRERFGFAYVARMPSSPKVEFGADDDRMAPGEGVELPLEASQAVVCAPELEGHQIHRAFRHSADLVADLGLSGLRSPEDAIDANPVCRRLRAPAAIQAEHEPIEVRFHIVRISLPEALCRLAEHGGQPKQRRVRLRRISPIEDRPQNVD